MKKTLLITIIFSLSIVTVFAQRGAEREKMTPEKRAERMTENLSEKLGLSEDQKNRIYQINLDYAKQREAEMEARRAEMKVQREEMRMKNQEQEEKVKEVLNENQREIFTELKDKRQERMENVREARRNPDSEKIKEWRKKRSEKNNNHR
jgi:periplasmic protein CpxP/Spy